MKTTHSISQTIIEMLVLSWCLTAQAAPPFISNIAMVPRLTIHSDLGITNQIQYSTNLSGVNWLPLTNVVVTESPYLFVDLDSPLYPRRFYRVIALNQTGEAPTNMSLIPAGSFVMGDNWDGDPAALPLHSVYVSSFYMDHFSVTRSLWNEVYFWATNNGYAFSIAAAGNTLPSHPVQINSWHDAVQWCNARSEKEGRVPAYYTSTAQTQVYRGGLTYMQNNKVKWNTGYRLPTEAEWEKAARGGADGQRFPWNDAYTITHDRANYYSSSSYPYDLSQTRGYHPDFGAAGIVYTSPVDYFSPNGYGLYDMAGNVSQWCWDWYGAYPVDHQTDPRGPNSGTSRVHRGGSWNSYAASCRAANRISIPGPGAGASIGFRCVLPQ